MRLSIRPEQRAVIEQVAEENFVGRVVAHLRREYPDATVALPEGERTTVAALDDDALDALVRAGIERARGHGLALESSISAFVATMFEAAPNFDDHRLCQVLLEDEEIEPDQRLGEMLDVLTDKNWEAVRAAYDPQAWRRRDEAGDTPAESSESADAAGGEAGGPDLLQTVKI